MTPLEMPDKIAAIPSGGMDEDTEFAWFISTEPIVANYPEVSSLRSYAFYSSPMLTVASFPACTAIGSYAFAYCSNLTTASFPACITIGGYAFYNCRLLLGLYLTGPQYITLSASNAFNSTPIAGYTTSTGGVYGSIYVPASMLETYKTRTNWSFFSSRFAEV